MVLCACEKVLKVFADQLPQKTLLLKCLTCLVNNAVFNSVTLCHRCITMLHIGIIYAYIHGRDGANWKLKYTTEPIRGTASSTCSGVCELTNQSRPGIWAGDP